MKETEVLRMTALASDAATQDPLDLALLAGAEAGLLPDPLSRAASAFCDPATCRSEAHYRAGGVDFVVMKGTAGTLINLVRISLEERPSLLAAS